ncbi:hypothetical protein TWF106_010222 [Orbilia oligospora]|uniref:NACHT domain-containing protein n=1 Tax=Orbilia oligospora TaxID=2813651 RepID=A0A7C8QIC1_ORBOL|nr:hypothetical protein TWF106_010222 [Orbilia oligospora]
MANRKDYTVGWICAIECEYTAAKTFLDKKHPTPEDIPLTDNNVYTLGEISKHNVVIVTLPSGQYGISSATAVVKDMLNTFQNIRIGLMVGIGGGAPVYVPGADERDIRLGDVVVSKPFDGQGGVIQYDFGKNNQGQDFKLTGFLNQPPLLLLAAITELSSEYAMIEGGNGIKGHINSVLEKYPTLRANYERPSSTSDKLYRSEIVHPDNATAEASCATLCGDDLSRLTKRPERPKDDNPVIHYGLIASANQLMKNAVLRDKLAVQNKILCFEMEAAGIMNQFPCLVIRGICDYSDSHKNKKWQGYAAMAAAAYAKDLLTRISPRKVEAEKKVIEIPGILTSIEKKIDELHASVARSMSTEKRQDIYRWLSPPDSSTNYNAAIKEHLQGSGLWFIESSKFSEWKIQRNSRLWLHGIPGCGKTILSSIVIAHLKRIYPDQLLYFYFDYKDVDKQSLEGMLRGLINQLWYRSRRSSGVCSGVLESLFTSYHYGEDQPTQQSLRTTFLSMAEKTGEIWLVLDALDECNREKRKELMLWINEINAGSEERNIHLLITSRPAADIESEVRKYTTESCIISIGSELISEDINAYIRCRVAGDAEFSRWKSRVEQTEIEDVLAKKANGMFRWAKCQLDVLGNCLDPDSLHKALGSLPENLDETYARIIRNIPNIYRQKAIRILQFLTYSPRPVEVVEIVDALVVDMDGKTYFDPSRRMPCPNEVLHYCSGLVVISSQKRNPELQLAHLSVREYLTSDRLGVVDLQISRGLQEVDAKTSMAKICIAYLLSLNITFNDNPGKSESPPFPFFRYCAKYWTTFARTTEEVDEKMQCLLLQFFDNEKLYKRCYQEQFYRDSMTSALQYASKAGLRVQVEHFLSQKVDVDRDCICAVNDALYEGHWGIVELFLNKGVRTDTKEMAGALYRASSDGCCQVVKFLLQRGVDADGVGAYFGLPLAAASSRGHLSVVELLLDYGADLNIDSYPWGYPLRAASHGEHYGVVELLLERGAKIGLHGSQLREAFAVACRRPSWDIIKLFLDRGFDVKAHGGSALRILSSGNSGNETSGAYSMVKLLLDKGADINSSGAVCGAANGGNQEILKMLLDRGADLLNMAKALSAASCRGNYSMVKLLLERGANINSSTAVYEATTGGNHEILELFLDKGADLSNTAEALFVASFNGHRNIVRILLDAAQGSNTNDNDKRSRFALYNASVGGHRDVVELLLNRVSPKHQSHAVYLAADRGHDDVVEGVLNTGTFIGNASAALCVGSSKGYSKIVRLILNSGVPADRDRALKAALRNGHQEIVEMLSGAGTNTS